MERANRTHTEEFYEVTDSSFELDSHLVECDIIRKSFPTNFGEVMAGEPAKVLMTDGLMIPFFADIALLVFSVKLIIAARAKWKKERCVVSLSWLLCWSSWAAC